MRGGCWAASISTSRCWWRQPLPHPLLLPVCWLREEKTHTHTPHPLYFLPFFHPNPSTHRCWGSGISVLLPLRAWMCLPLPCLLPASQQLGGDARLTHSSPLLPPFCGHMIWAMTKYGRSPAIAALHHSSFPGLCVCVVSILDQRGYSVCVGGLLLMPDNNVLQLFFFFWMQ